MYSKVIDWFCENEEKIKEKIICEFFCVFSSYSRWEFRTFDHDIRFGIKRVNEKTNEQNIEIDMKRVASHQLDEEGFITCQPDWTCENISFCCSTSSFIVFYLYFILKF